MSFLLVQKGITSNLLRSGLTILGIAIGISAVIGLLSISLGLSKTVSERVAKFGQNMFIITPGGGFVSVAFKTFDKSDADLIGTITGVDFVSPRYTAVVPAEFKGKKFDVRISGVKPEGVHYMLSQAGVASLYQGTVITSGKQAILGKTLWRDLDEPGIGQSILLKGEKFKIVGILNSVGMPFMDTALIMPLDEAWSMTGKQEYSLIIAFVSDPSVEQRIKQKLDQKLGKGEFTIMTSKQMAQQAEEILAIINGFLFAITGVSVIVGAFGIANTMFVSVTERISEIGVMKTLGATNKLVSSLIVQESILLAIIGGIVGITVGHILGGTIVYIASLYQVELVSFVPAWATGATIILTIVLGAVSGFIPAYEAAKLDPVEALKL